MKKKMPAYIVILVISIAICTLNVLKLKDSNEYLHLQTSRNVYNTVITLDFWCDEASNDKVLSFSLNESYSSSNLSNINVYLDIKEKYDNSFIISAQESFDEGKAEYYEYHPETHSFHFVRLANLESCGTVNVDRDGAINIVLDTKRQDNYYHKQLIIIIFINSLVTLVILIGTMWYKKVISAKEAELRESNMKLKETNSTLVSMMREQVSENLQQEDLIRRQSKYASMGEMIGVIAHQWRQPLNVLGLYIQDLEDGFKYGEVNATYIKEMVAKSMSQINYMSKPIDDFRNFFKPDREEEVFRVKEALSDLYELIEPSLSARDIILTIEVHEISVMGFKNEFKQAFLNFVNNASDAIVDRGAKERLITVSDRLEGDYIIITVDDTGGGIPDDGINRLFEPYFTTKNEGEGTGLGLYMAKLILEKHMKGRVWITNIDKGARVSVKLRIVAND